MSAVETSIRQSIIVHAPRAHAFKVFTEGFDSWWPRTHRIGKGEPFAGILECREGGRWFERAADGSECEWGRVLVYAPPTQLTLAWHLNGNYAYDADPAKASRVDVTFHDEGDGKTRVDLVHTQLERHAVEWEKVRDSVGSVGGWPLILGRYAASFTSS